MPGTKYIVIRDFEAVSNSHISLSIGMVVQFISIQIELNVEYCLVCLINKDGTTGAQGLVPATHLEPLVGIDDDVKRLSNSVKIEALPMITGDNHVISSSDNQVISLASGENQVINIDVG